MSQGFVVLGNERPGNLNQLFFGQDNFSENSCLLNRPLPEFFVKSSNILAGIGQKLLQMWGNCFKFGLSAASRDQPRACCLLFFHSVKSSGLGDFIGFSEKKGTTKFLIHFHLLSSTIVTRGNQLPQTFLLPGIPSTLR